MTVLSVVSSGSQLTARIFPPLSFVSSFGGQRTTALTDLLRTEPKVGIEWSNAIHAIGVLGGYSADSGQETLKNLREFALNSRCYSCTAKDGNLPDTPRISEAGVAAKSEVSFAIVNFGKAAKEAGNAALVHDATDALKDAAKPEHWDHIEWTTATADVDGGPPLKDRLAADALREKIRLFAYLSGPHRN